MWLLIAIFFGGLALKIQNYNVKKNITQTNLLNTNTID